LTVFRLENAIPVAIRAMQSDRVMFHVLEHLPLLSSPKPENERTLTSEDVNNDKSLAPAHPAEGFFSLGHL
jgi:hypothetical protein